MGIEGVGGGGGSSSFVVGSAIQAAQVATSEATVSAAYTDLTTVGPSVTLVPGASGIAIVRLSALVKNNTADSAGWLAVALSGGNTVAAADTEGGNAVNHLANQVQALSIEVMLSGLVAVSTVFKIQYRAGSNTATFAQRVLSVITY